MESQGNQGVVGGLAAAGAGAVVPPNLAALAANNYETASELSSAAAATLRAITRGEMPLDSGVKFGSVLGRAIKAKELHLKCGPFGG